MAFIFSQKTLFRCSVFFLFLVRFFYIFSFPLNFGGDASVYYTMLVHKHSNLLMAGGYPFFIMFPYHCLRKILSLFWVIPEDAAFTPWWQSSNMRMALLGQASPNGDFSWIEVFQDHGFLIFQHSLALSALFCGFYLMRKYFHFPVAILFLLLAGLSPLSLEWPSCSLPEWLQGAFLVFWLYWADQAKEASGVKKLMLYAALGANCALGILIKFNGLPLYALFFFALLYWDKEKLGKTLTKAGVYLAAALCVFWSFISFYHFPTTGTRVLSLNSWPLADKVFQYLPHPSLSPDLGICTKRLLASHKPLPKNNEKVLGPAIYFRHLDAVGNERSSYRQKLSWLMNATNNQLDLYIQAHGVDPIYMQAPALRVAYYIGLPEYSSLLKGIYIEALQKYPLHFLKDTLQNFFCNFSMRANSYFFQPNWEEVATGRMPTSRFGFVEFKWPSERYVCYHKNVVWLPGVWFFTQWQSFWPPTYLMWLFAFLAIFIALKNRTKEKNLVLFLAISVLLFVLFSNAIWMFRLKEYELIRLPVTGLASVGLFQSAQIIYQFIKTSMYRRKLLQIFSGT